MYVSARVGMRGCQLSPFSIPLRNFEIIRLTCGHRYDILYVEGKNEQIQVHVLALRYGHGKRTASALPRMQSNAYRASKAKVKKPRLKILQLLPIYYMGEVYRRTFVVGDLVTIAPDFRNSVMDFDFEKYVGIVVSAYEDNEYTVHWTSSPVNNYYKGMWNGDHLVKVENYEAEKHKVKRLHIMEI